MITTSLLELDSVFDAIFARPTHRPVAGPQKLHVEETDEAYILRAALPGVVAEDVDLDVTAEGVRLSASRTNPAPEGFHPVRRERTSFTLNRSWKTPLPIDPERADAQLTNGILTVTLPKAPAVTPRKLTVNS